MVAAQNYAPGGIKLFDAATLEPLADIPAIGMDGKRSKVVGLADLPGRRLAASLFESGEIWIIDINDPRKPQVTQMRAGREPYDGFVTPDGRWYIAGLFGEDGLALVDLWQSPPEARRILSGYGRGTDPLPVYKMPHLRGWAMAQGMAWLPAVGRHEVLVADAAQGWKESARVALAGQPVFVMARPDGRQVWVNFAFPHNDTVQVIDTATRQVVQTMRPCRGVLHMEFTPKGEAVWLSCRDDNRVEVYDTATFARSPRCQRTTPAASSSPYAPSASACNRAGNGSPPCTTTPCSTTGSSETCRCTRAHTANWPPNWAFASTPC